HKGQRQRDGRQVPHCNARRCAPAPGERRRSGGKGGRHICIGGRGPALCHAALADALCDDRHHGPGGSGPALEAPVCAGGRRRRACWAPVQALLRAGGGGAGPASDARRVCCGRRRRALQEPGSRPGARRAAAARVAGGAGSAGQRGHPQARPGKRQCEHRKHICHGRGAPRVPRRGGSDERRAAAAVVGHVLYASVRAGVAPVQLHEAPGRVHPGQGPPDHRHRVQRHAKGRHQLQRRRLPAVQRRDAVRRVSRPLPVHPRRGERAARGRPRPRALRAGCRAVLQHMSLPWLRQEDCAGRRARRRLLQGLRHGRPHPQ
ncbi:hypothetical protein H4R21_007119, partial [Coemansia helicoidea]